MPLQPAPEDYVKIFTDGACSGNPGPGGWAFIMEHPASGKRIERAGAEPLTTNNRMEITSALQGLILLKRPCRVEIVTDSQYLAKGILEWLPGWKANGFRRREGHQFKPLQNEDLWRAVDEQLQRHEIQVMHVRGHSGHPENERCDQMAVAAYKRLMAGTLAAATPPSQKFGEQSPQTQVRTRPSPESELRQAEPTPPRLPEKSTLVQTAEPPKATDPVNQSSETQPGQAPEELRPSSAPVAEPVVTLKSAKPVKSSSRKSAPEPELIFDMLAAPVVDAPEKEKPARRKSAAKPKKTSAVESQPEVAAQPTVEKPAPSPQKQVEKPLAKPVKPKARTSASKKVVETPVSQSPEPTPTPKRTRKKAVKTETPSDD